MKRREQALLLLRRLSLIGTLLIALISTLIAVLLAIGRCLIVLCRANIVWIVRLALVLIGILTWRLSAIGLTAVTLT